MKRLARRLGFAALAVVAVLSLVAGVAWGRSLSKANQKWDVAVTAVPLPTDEASVQEGGRLFAARGCQKCHGPDGAGVLVLDVPLLGTAYGANLTRGRGSATAAYTDADWVRTVRHGVKPSGAPTQVMDALEYQFISDRDLGLIVAFVKQLPPVDRENPALRILPLSRIFHGLGMLDVTSADLVDHQRTHATDPTPDAGVDFGAYVVRLQCQNCHGEHLSGGTLSGAPGLAVPANLTPDDATGLGRWTFANFATAMRTGKRLDGGTLDSLMPWDVYGAMSDDELHAIWAYLRTLPPRPFGGR